MRGQIKKKKILNKQSISVGQYLSLSNVFLLSYNTTNELRQLLSNKK